MKKRIILFIFLFLSALSIYDASSYPGGIAGRSGGFGDSNCASCHGGSTGSSPIVVTGVIVGLNPGDKYELSKTYQGYVDITYPGRNHWGVNVMIIKNSILNPGDNAGTIVVTDKVTTHIMHALRGGIYYRRYLTHTDAIGKSSSPVIGQDHYRFNFTWVSPSTPVGDIGFAWTGMATGSDGGRSNDFIGFGNSTFYAPF